MRVGGLNSHDTFLFLWAGKENTRTFIVQSSTSEAFFLPYHNLNFKMCCFESVFWWNWGFLNLAETLSIKKSSNRPWPALEMEELRRVLWCSSANRSPGSDRRWCAQGCSGTGAAVTFLVTSWWQRWPWKGPWEGRAALGDVWSSWGGDGEEKLLKVKGNVCWCPPASATIPPRAWRHQRCLDRALDVVGGLKIALNFGCYINRSHYTSPSLGLVRRVPSLPRGQGRLLANYSQVFVAHIEKGRIWEMRITRHPARRTPWVWFVMRSLPAVWARPVARHKTGGKVLHGEVFFAVRGRFCMVKGGFFLHVIPKAAAQVGLQKRLFNFLPELAHLESLRGSSHTPSERKKVNSLPGCLSDRGMDALGGQ